MAVLKQSLRLLLACEMIAYSTALVERDLRFDLFDIISDMFSRYYFYSFSIIAATFSYLITKICLLLTPSYSNEFLLEPFFLRTVL